MSIVNPYYQGQKLRENSMPMHCRTLESIHEPPVERVGYVDGCHEACFEKYF